MSHLKLYRFVLSGHSHRVELFISLLGLDVQLIDIDLPNGEHKKTEFLNKNCFGEVPVLEDNEIIIADSNAILTYLAIKYDKLRTWLPVDAVSAAEVQRFLSVAAGPLSYGPAAARIMTLFGGGQKNHQAIEKSYALLDTLEKHLQTREWLVGEYPTIADIANYTYIAHAPEGYVSLAKFPAIQIWIAKIESLFAFVAMKSSAVGLNLKNENQYETV